MNYYNPYYSFIPYSVPVREGLFTRLLGNGINWSSILNNTQKVLGIANQAIPMVKQITPVMRNAKTMFQVMNEFKKQDEVVENKVENVERIKTEGPTFFI